MKDIKGEIKVIKEDISNLMIENKYLDDRVNSIENKLKGVKIKNGTR